MDFTKYISLLHRKTLFFSRADLLGDPYEGSISRKNKELYPIIYRTYSLDMRERMSSITKGAVQWTYVNCWYMNEHESNAMWVSTNTDKSVVIQSTYKKLNNCLSSATINPDEYLGGINLGVVNYVNYKNYFVPEGNIFSPFMHKRQEFDYEKELRALIHELPPEINNSRNYGIPNKKRGVSIDVNVDALIEAVYTNPLADIWFTDLVKSVSQKYGFELNIEQSSMVKPPCF